MVYWFLTAGALLLGMALWRTHIERLPFSTSNVYLLLGVAIGPYGAGLLGWDAVRESRLLEHLSEIAVIVSLFTVGLTLRRSPGDRAWRVPLRLATLTMLITVALLALVAWRWLGLPLGAAILLAAILAPTDPVLAADVQVRGVRDDDPVRYGLSGEAGLNDGAAFPLVMLGLGLLGLHPAASDGGWMPWAAQAPFSLGRWLLWDVGWATAAGLAVGALTGNLIGRWMLQRRRTHPEAFGLQAFIVLGIIALAYGLAELIYGYGFLAVFAAGYALRLLELRASNYAPQPPETALKPLEDDAVEPVHKQRPAEAAHYLALSLRQFTTQLEHILEALMVVVIGGMLTSRYWAPEVLWLAPLLFGVLRPLASWLGLVGSATSGVQRWVIGWFGIRGIGSIYYLTYAINHQLPAELAQRLTAIVLSLIVVSIVAHGMSVTPVMRLYERIRKEPV